MRRHRSKLTEVSFVTMLCPLNSKMQLESTYEKLVDKMFEKRLGKTMEVYVDDMVIKSKQAAQYVDNQVETLAIPRHNDIKVESEQVLL